MRDVNPFELEQLTRRFAERVGSDRPDHRDAAVCAERARRGDGLVPALAALVLGEPAADDRLACHGEP